MKNIKLIIAILIIFFKTGNVLSENNLFNVNNVEIIKDKQITNEKLANQAILKAFNKLMERILLKKDIVILKKLELSEIKKLVSYYQILDDSDNSDKIKFNILFDKEKLYDLFYKSNISYSNLIKNELYILPILKKGDQIFIYTQNYFYENWNKQDEEKLIEFVLPIENIETIQKINSNRNNLYRVDLRDLFKEYSKQNLAIIIIEDKNSSTEKIFFKADISGKNISKNLEINRSNLNDEDFYLKIITIVKKELINLIKSQNLIDIRTPSFVNTKFKLNKNNNLVELNKRLRQIDEIENIYVQEFNNQFVLIKIKFFGKVDKIVNEFKKKNILIEPSGESWSIKIIK